MNNIYYPDNWIVVRINKDDKVHYKLFTTSENEVENKWRINSDITKVMKERDNYLFLGESGSVYSCKIKNYGLNDFGKEIYNDLLKLYNIKVMNDCDWNYFDFSK